MSVVNGGVFQFVHGSVDQIVRHLDRLHVALLGRVGVNLAVATHPTHALLDGIGLLIWSAQSGEKNGLHLQTDFADPGLQYELAHAFSLMDAHMRDTPSIAIMAWRNDMTLLCSGRLDVSITDRSSIKDRP